MRENGERESGASGGAKESVSGGIWNQNASGGKSPLFSSQADKSGVRKEGVRREGNDVVYGNQNPGTQFTYRDKLLSLGDSGFLEVNMSACDALNGWKDYLTRMSNKNTSVDAEEEEEEQYGEEAGANWQQGGKYPKLKFTAEEYENWCKPYSNSLIVKLLGKSFRVGFMRQRMERMWNPKSPMKITPLSNGYFIISFSTREDRDYALLEGPWMIADHYLMIQRWRPNFNPWKADNQKKIAAWIRFPDLPAELYSIESLRRLGNLVGKTLKIDRTTAFSEKGGFARICVELDLNKPLLPFFNHFGEDRKIEYEGLHLVCFHCGQYGHHIGVCQYKNPVQSKEDGEIRPTQASGKSTDEERDNLKKKAENSEKGEAKKEMFGPQMLVRRDFSRNNNKVDLGGSSSNAGSKKGITNHKGSQKRNEHNIAKDKGKMAEKKDENEGSNEGRCQIGGETNKSGIEQKWVPVVEKRITGIKRQARGKMNMARGKLQTQGTIQREENGNLDENNFLSQNPFAVLKGTSSEELKTSEASQVDEIGNQNMEMGQGESLQDSETEQGNYIRNQSVIIMDHDEGRPALIICEDGIVRDDEDVLMGISAPEIVKLS